MIEEIENDIKAIQFPTPKMENAKGKNRDVVLNSSKTQVDCFLTAGNQIIFLSPKLEQMN